MSRVSVILPVRNGAALVEDALRSLLSQSPPPDEIIVVDDGSTDETATIVRRTAPQARMLWTNGRGPAAARNQGVRHASGDLVGFIDHDDCWTPGRLVRQAAILESEPEVDAVLGCTQVMVASADRSGFELPGPPFPAMSLGAMLLRRGVFERVGLFDESRRFSEDVAWIATARARGLRLRVERETAQRYRRHGANMTKDRRADRQGFFLALRAAVRARNEIAVIIAVRNGERFLADALESVEEQTLPPAEVVVVDGRSEDRTCEIAARFPFARVIRREPRGVADANNAGIEATRSPLVAFLSHDDRFSPRKLELQAARLAEDPALDFVVGRAAFECAAGCTPPPGFRRELLGRAVPAYIMETLLARRTLLQRVGPFDASLRSAEDVDWFARAFHLGARGSSIDDVVVRKRVHDSNTSLDAAANTAHLLRALRSAVRRARTPSAGGRP
jgi:glycosyltransferase involved in cell wall biosynthesis